MRTRRCGCGAFHRAGITGTCRKHFCIDISRVNAGARTTGQASCRAATSTHIGGSIPVSGRGLSAQKRTQCITSRLRASSSGEKRGWPRPLPIPASRQCRARTPRACGSRGPARRHRRCRYAEQANSIGSKILAENDTPPVSPELSVAIIDNAFGAENRARIIDTYFAGRGTPTAADAWQNVYRLLLWIDATTGLAHCYESDKSQPGRNWYARSLAFHAWASSELGVTTLKLADEIDYLFRRATEDLAAVAIRRRDAVMRIAERQREPDRKS